MATQLQLRRGTTEQNANFVGAQGEITMDIDTNALRVHNGTTAGGAAIIDTIVAFQRPTEENGYTWYRRYSSGWVEQGGNIEFTSNPQSISLPVEMTDANYTANATSNYSSASGWAQIISKTTTGLSVGMYYGNGTNSVAGPERTVSWQVSGMAA